MPIKSRLKQIVYILTDIKFPSNFFKKWKFECLSFASDSILPQIFLIWIRNFLDPKL